MEQCASCRHWQAIDLGDGRDARGYFMEAPTLRDDEGDRVYEPDTYAPVTAPGRWGWCQRVAELGPQKASRFYVVDGSDYMAKLGTREDFGCVEHEVAVAIRTA